MRASELKVCTSIRKAVHLVAQTAKQKPMVYMPRTATALCVCEIARRKARALNFRTIWRRSNR